MRVRVVVCYNGLMVEGLVYIVVGIDGGRHFFVLCIYPSLRIIVDEVPEREKGPGLHLPLQLIVHRLL